MEGVAVPWETMMEVKNYIHLVFKKWRKIKINQSEQHNHALLH